MTNIQHVVKSFKKYIPVYKKNSQEHVNIQHQVQEHVMGATSQRLVS